MKKLSISIEQKAKAYDEALKKAKDMLSYKEVRREDMEYLFPELKESEDERVRKAIIATIHLYYGEPLEDEAKEMIAWIEKQVQKPVFEMKTPEESLGIDSDTYNKIVDECIYGEQNLADKNEPKFHEGDWVVWEDKCYKVNYNGCGYELVDQDGLSTSLEYGTIDENAHIWDVTTDAKDGDVLHSPTHNLIWIHKDIQHYHACVNMNYVKENFSTDGFIVTPTDVCPATKDKQTILFAEMKEAGYEWDAEKKEPKKIEQQPTDNDMKELLHTEYEKGRADAIAEIQNPAWSEEDEEFLRRAINATKDVYPMTAKWLKFLKDRVQPKQEWSKKDNQYLCGLIGLIEQSKAELPITLKGKAADNCIDWLKSLKKRYTWKPSDEQLEALKNAIQIKPFENPSDSILWGLYEQLKKL